MIQSVLVDEQFITAGNLVGGERLTGCYLAVGHRLAVILEGRGHKPAVLVNKHLVNTHLVTIGAVVELGMIDQIVTTIGRGDDAVVPLRALANGHLAPVVVSPHQLLATGVAFRTVVGGTA